MMALCGGHRKPKRLAHGASRSMHLPRADCGRGEEKRAQTDSEI